MSQTQLDLDTKIRLLYLILPLVDIYRDDFVRRCNAAKSKERVFQETLILTGDYKQALVKQAWQQINLSRE